MSVRVVRLGTPRVRGEGLRIGTVRRPPRGVRKSEYARRDFYDVWLPDLAPSPAAIAIARSARWAAFVARYRREMSRLAPRRLLELLAALSRSTNFSVGCYCEDPARCHRSVLGELLRERGADLA